MPLLRADLDQFPAYTRPAGEEALAACARLHMNEAAEDWPVEAREALLARLANLPFRFYPERQAELGERLRRRLGAPAGGLLLGPSSGALLDLVALAGLEPGDTVAVPDPGFSLYPLLVKRHRGALRRVPVGTGFPLAPWFDALEAGARQLWLTLPNNPTGAWLPPADLKALLDASAARRDPPLVLLDEAYAEFAPLTHRLALEGRPNVLILRTFSKALASAGWRLGYLLGDPALISRLASLQLPYSIPSASLEALDVALDFAGAFEGRVREAARRRDRLAMALRTADGIAIQFLIAGQKAGKGSEVTIAEPIGDLNVEQIEGLSVVRLSRLIEMKIACGMSNLRRTHKDFADVVELISIRNLDGKFARFLHQSLRPAFRELVRNATASDDE